MIKKIIALLLIVSITFTLASCKNNENTGETEKEYVLPTQIIDSDISLPYTSADVFHPYSSKSSLNRDLIPIMYESLFNSTDDGKGEKVLCESAILKGKNLTVKILNNVKFSDGSELIAKHIKSSFEKAKGNSFYKDGLSLFTSVKIIDNYTLVFTLKHKDIMANNVLNFPVCKQNGKNFLGTGKYSVAYLDSTPYLQVNTNHRAFVTSWNKQISLYDMAGITSPVYSFKANDISVYKNDLSSGKYVNLSSKTISQQLNNFVYVGVNTTAESSMVSLNWVRQAINIGLNRRTVTAASFLGQGTPTSTPFKAEFYALKDAELPSIDGETQRAVSILERNGYKNVNSEGYRTNGSNTLSVNILVCSENEYKLSVAKAVKQSLNDLGFKVTISEKKTPEEYKEALGKGQYGLYIGEVQLTDNCDLSEFFSKTGVCSYGVNEAFYKEYSDYKNGSISTIQFVESFSTEVPFVPLFYRKAVVAVNPNVTGVDERNIYNSVCQWEMTEKK